MALTQIMRGGRLKRKGGHADMLKGIWRLVVIILLIFVTFTVTQSQTKVDKVNIGVVYPRTGAQARLGETCVQACILAAEDINKAGGIKSLAGAKIELIIADCRSDVSATRSEVERLCTRYKLSALTGSYVSGLTLPATEVSERYRIPWITGSVADGITGRGFKYVFQVSPKASHFGHMQVALVKELGEKIGPPAKKVAIVYEDTAYGTATSKGLQEKSKEMGLETVLYEAYKGGFTDAAPLVTKIKASGAEILFPVSYLTDAILIIKTMREMKVNATVVGGGAGYLMPEFEKDLGKDAEYIYSVASWNWDLPYPEVTDMARRYEKRYGEFIQEHAGEAYCMVWVLAEAIGRAGSLDPEKVKEALTKTNLTKGPGAIMPGYHVEFDHTGWNEHVHPVMVQWQKGKLRAVWPSDVAAAKPIWPVPPWEKR